MYHCGYESMGTSMQLLAWHVCSNECSIQKLALDLHAWRTLISSSFLNLIKHPREAGFCAAALCPGSCCN